MGQEVLFLETPVPARPKEALLKSFLGPRGGSSLRGNSQVHHTQGRLFMPMSSKSEASEMLAGDLLVKSGGSGSCARGTVLPGAAP